MPVLPSSPTEPQRAMQCALAELLLEIDPDVAGRIAVSCLRLAAAAVAMRDARLQGARVAAEELLLLLSDGPPSVDALAAAAG